MFDEELMGMLRDMVNSANKLRLETEVVVGSLQAERFYKMLEFLRTIAGTRQQRALLVCPWLGR